MTPTDIDPYEVLGVSREATKAQIREAYRRLAKKLHPDAPNGDKEAFERLKLCYDILIDDERRARYEATGELHQGGADNEMAIVIQMITKAFDETVREVVQRQQKPARVNLLELMKARLGEEHRKVADSRGKIDAELAILDSVKGRFKVKRGQRNLMQDVIRAKEERIRRPLGGLQDAERRLARAVEILDDYRYETEIMQMLTRPDVSITFSW